MRVLVDTVTLIWAMSASHRISASAMAVLNSEDAVCEVSAISISEIAIKQVLGKIDLPRHQVQQALSSLQFGILPFTEEHAFTLFDLPLHHRDPFDRQIIAQALTENIPVVTSDRAFRLYQGLSVLW